MIISIFESLLLREKVKAPFYEEPDQSIKSLLLHGNAHTCRTMCMNSENSKG